MQAGFHKISVEGESCENGACEGTQAVLANLVQSVRRKIASFSCIGSLFKTHKGMLPID